MSIRAIFLDMDGTLLGNSQVAVSLRNMEAVQRAIRAGIQVIPCTGRVYDMLPPQILTQEGLRYFITCHGARVYDKQTGESLYENLISPAHAAALLGRMENRGLYNEIALNNTILLEKSVADSLPKQPVPVHHVWYMADHCYTAAETPSQYVLKNVLGVEKFNLYGVPEDMQQSLYDDLTATGFIRHTRPGAGANLEFSAAAIDKAAAVDALMKRLGIAYAETIALGDSSSDLDVMRKAGVGVAMGNAPESIRREADDVTALNVDDGVAKALEKYLFA